MHVFMYFPHLVPPLHHNGKRSIVSITTCTTVVNERGVFSVGSCIRKESSLNTTNRRGTLPMFPLDTLVILRVKVKVRCKQPDAKLHFRIEASGQNISSFFLSKVGIQRAFLPYYSCVLTTVVSITQNRNDSCWSLAWRVDTQ